jgi:RNA polymerase sigma factor (sigma-70 family)
MNARAQDLEQIEQLLRVHAPRALGALVRRYRNFEYAEDAVQEAVLSAWQTWPSSETPANPTGWLVTAARHRLFNRLRHESRRFEKELAAWSPSSSPAADDSTDSTGSIDWNDPELTPLDDDQLRLIFMCCHPALADEPRVALTLRAVGGLTTSEIAHAFLVPEATMAQRIVRAKRKIVAAGISFDLPTEESLLARTEAVLQVVYLVFNAGYASTRGSEVVQVDLCHEAIRLGRLLRALLPDDSTVAALLALMLLHDARRAGRSDAAGRLVPLAEQNRSTWDRAQIAEGVALVERALVNGPVGRYQVQAAIAAVHAEALTAGQTDWPQILALYGILEQLMPGPLVALNRAVPVAEVHGPQAGLDLLDAIASDPQAATLGHRLPAARGHLLERLGRFDDAAAAYRKAAALCPSLAELRYLEGKLHAVNEQTWT